jgi:hypothetical protein
MSSMPGICREHRTSRGTSRRTSGSPPVSRTRRSPMPAMTRTTSAISSYVRISLRASHGSPCFRHAVHAAQVALVGDGDAQVLDAPPEAVAHRGRPVRPVRPRLALRPPAAPASGRAVMARPPASRRPASEARHPRSAPASRPAALLDGLDDVARGVERLGAVRRAHRNGHADLAYGQFARAVHHGHTVRARTAAASSAMARSTLRPSRRTRRTAGRSPPGRRSPPARCPGRRGRAVGGGAHASSTSCAAMGRG